MIKLEHVVLASPEQMEFIIEGMRNPHNSWEKSDSKCCSDFPHLPIEGSCKYCEHNKNCDKSNADMHNHYILGDNDHSLM